VADNEPLNRRLAEVHAMMQDPEFKPPFESSGALDSISMAFGGKSDDEEDWEAARGAVDRWVNSEELSPEDMSIALSAARIVGKWTESNWDIPEKYKAATAEEAPKTERTSYQKVMDHATQGMPSEDAVAVNSYMNRTLNNFINVESAGSRSHGDPGMFQITEKTGTDSDIRKYIGNNIPELDIGIAIPGEMSVDDQWAMGAANLLRQKGFVKTMVEDARKGPDPKTDYNNWDKYHHKRKVGDMPSPGASGKAYNIRAREKNNAIRKLGKGVIDEYPMYEPPLPKTRPPAPKRPGFAEGGLLQEGLSIGSDVPTPDVKPPVMSTQRKHIDESNDAINKSMKGNPFVHSMMDDEFKLGVRTEPTMEGVGNTNDNYSGSMSELGANYSDYVGSSMSGIVPSSRGEGFIAGVYDPGNTNVTFSQDGIRKEAKYLAKGDSELTDKFISGSQARTAAHEFRHAGMDVFRAATSRELAPSLDQYLSEDDRKVMNTARKASAILEGITGDHKGFIDNMDSGSTENVRHERLKNAMQAGASVLNRVMRDNHDFRKEVQEYRGVFQ
jgi:hypothetical protein